MKEFGLGWSERVEPKDLERFLVLSEMMHKGAMKGGISEVKTGKNKKVRTTVL